MSIEAKLQDFTQGAAKLHFVVGVSGFIMKELQNESATVYCWESECSAKDFISSKFSEKQRRFYEVQSLDIDGFEKLKHTIKFLPEKAVVNVEFYRYGITVT